MRLKIAYILFSLSGFFKGLGKLIITKEKTIVVNVLTLPGWFILDNCMIHQVGLSSKDLIGFEWHTYPMPEDWCKIIEEHKNKIKRSK